MEYRLRKPTQFKRRTLTRIGREIVPVEPGDANLLRRVTIFAPATPVVYFAIEPQEVIEGDLDGVDDAGASPDDIGKDRSYQWAPIGGLGVPFLIRADQYISASAESDLATLGVIIEYLEA